MDNMDSDFKRFQVLTFDCYGTLIDWERGILAVLRPWAEREGLTASDDQLLEAFGRSEHRQEQAESGYRPYPEILKAVFADIAAGFGRQADAATAAAFAGSVGDWPPFADTVEALAKLKQRHRLMVVSNVDRASFAGTQKLLGVEFDAVVTAEDVQSYKPGHAHFHRAFEIAAGWGTQQKDILHVAQSLFHDHVPAKQLGLNTVWVDRRSGKSGGATPLPADSVRPDWIVPSLQALLSLEDGAAAK